MAVITSNTAYADQERAYDSQLVVKPILTNDNPFLNLFPDLFYVDDDHGDTHGLGVEIEIVPEKGVFQNGEKWTINLKSDLYTKDLTPEGQDLFPNPPQKFNEVTRFNVTWDNILASQDRGKIYYLMGAGIGRINDMDDSGWGGAGQQRRWHDYKHNNLTPESTPMYDNQYGDTNELFLTGKVGAGKIIRFDNSMTNCQCEVNRIKVEAGAEVFTISKGSRVYVFVGVDKSLIRYKKHSIGVEFNNLVNFYATGDTQLRTFGGLYYRYGRFILRTGFTKKMGDHNNEFYKYEDDDDIWMIQLEIPFSLN